MPDVRALYIAGHSLMHVLVHAVGLRLCMVWRMAILGAAVGTIHPRAFCIWIHCHDIKVIVAVRLGVMRILCWLLLGYRHLWASLPLSGGHVVHSSWVGFVFLVDPSLIRFFKLFVQMLQHKAFMIMRKNFFSERLTARQLRLSSCHYRLRLFFWFHQ